MLRSMRVEIDVEMCQGHGRCAVVCPELFDIDDSGYGFVRTEVPDAFTADLVSRARQAVLNCPERAITLIESEGEPS
jgi:ferredoxin